MKPTADYFRRRRRRLRKRGLCVRCGDNPAAKGHRLCALCLEEKKLKRPDPPNARKRRKWEKRVAEIEAIRARLLAQSA